MLDLSQFSLFVDRMNENNSRNYKKEVLREYADNATIKKFLNFLFNPHIVNGISTSKLKKQFDSLPYIELGSLRVLEAIAEMRTGSDDAVKIVKAFCLKLNSKEKKLFESLVIKNLKLGVDIATLNEIMPNLIPTFSIMLANSYYDEIDNVKGKEFTLTRKIDGGRIIMLKEAGNVSFYTRAGKPYEGLIELEMDAEKLPDNIMLDGELVVYDTKGLDSKAQYKRTMELSRRKGIKHGLKMLVFDGMPVLDFHSQDCKMKYTERRSYIDSILKSTATTFFEALPILYQGKEMKLIETVLNTQIKNGEEGIMLNINDAPYEFKRSSSLLKIKKMQDIDLEVIRLEEGNGANKGKLGAFVVRYKDNEVKVGSGIDKETRELVWSDKDSYIGATIKVQYFEETTNKAGTKSLRFPVFLGFRDDKGPDF